MSATLTLHGIEEQRRAFRTLPRDLAQDSQPIVDSSAENVAAEIRAGYPRKTGRLANGVHTAPASTTETAAQARVVNEAPHAFIYEHGTAARHDALGRNRGMMRPGNVFIPRMIRARRAMFDRIGTVMTRYGLTVRNNAG